MIAFYKSPNPKTQFYKNVVCIACKYPFFQCFQNRFFNKIAKILQRAGEIKTLGNFPRPLCALRAIEHSERVSNTRIFSMNRSKITLKTNSKNNTFSQITHCVQIHHCLHSNTP